VLCCVAQEKLKILRVEVAESPKVEWVASHLQSDKILWSSHPNWLPPEILIDEELEASKSQVFLSRLPPDYTWEAGIFQAPLSFSKNFLF